MNMLAAVMQLLVAAAFVSIPMVRHRFGPAAKHPVREGVLGGLEEGRDLDPGQFRVALAAESGLH
ncbi:hypothetical protein [Streptomyces sp. NPDC001275]